LLVVVNKTTSTVARETLELKFCSTNSENAQNVVSQNALWFGAAVTTGKNPIRRMIAHGEANKLFIVQKTRQRIWRKCFSAFPVTFGWPT
jgi:hypothetical protein